MGKKQKKSAKKQGRGCVGTMVRLVLWGTVLALLVVVIGGSYLLQDYREFQQALVLQDGEGVVARVMEAGLIEQELYFHAWARQTGLTGKVRAGTIRLDGPIGLEELSAALRRGGLAEERVLTFPEGLTIFHVADLLEAEGVGSRAEVLELARDPARFGVEGVDTLEGYLFPDTYRFGSNVSAEQVLARKVRRYEEVTAPLFEAHQEALEGLAESYGFSPHDVIIMASLIERETGVTDERELVSRVFYNRLDRGMRLETDPTCVYGETTYLEIPHPRFCRDRDNVYSTYVNHGLPPGPIASPGRASIEAALRPDESEEAREYLFFVSRRDGTGAHHFSRTYEEHRQAIRRYLLSQ